MNYKIIMFLIVIIFSSCSRKNLIYFNDLPEFEAENTVITNQIDPRIQPLDHLSIVVNTLNPETNLLFNSGVISNIGGQGGQISTARSSEEGYRVDKEGFINFPILGKISVKGLTIEEATDKMTELLQAEAKNPIVNIKLQNFKFTVLGEVSAPNTYPIPVERINVIQALGLAGDLTIFGKRNNILLIREIEGERTTARLDLTSKEIFNSPYYYLQQNDIIYVEPVKARTEQASLARSNISIALSIATLLAFIFLM
jgi:polysaccharide biosynthesis/export protein